MVNAGPAVFISTSGPNPIMVQVNIHCFMRKDLIIFCHYFFIQSDPCISSLFHFNREQVLVQNRWELLAMALVVVYLVLVLAFSQGTLTYGFVQVNIFLPRISWDSTLLNYDVGWDVDY